MVSFSLYEKKNIVTNYVMKTRSNELVNGMHEMHTKTNFFAIAFHWEPITF